MKRNISPLIAFAMAAVVAGCAQGTLTDSKPAHTTDAQQVGARRIELQRQDLSVTGREVVQTIVELEPGTTAPRHTHQGEEIIYVLEGTWEYTLEGKPPVTLKAGDVLSIPAGVIHSARNVGRERGKELATYIVEKGKPLVELATSAPQHSKEVHAALPEGGSMATQTNNLYLLEDLDDASKTRQLAQNDLAALRTDADWIKSFVAGPHKELGRDGPVCPFVPEALQRKTLWLAPEHIAGRSVPEVVQLMSRYKKQLLQTQPLHGEGTDYKVIVVVFTDLPADRAPGVFGDVLKQLAVPSYEEDGILFGPFYEGNKGTAIYNSGFRPFQSPVPLLFVRHGVVSDWKFFLDNDEWLKLWAHRYGESGARALAEELRRLPWRARRD